MIRYTVQFLGHVQGVGFRYTARNVARGHRVAGYVQNLHDSTVRLVIEGEAADLDAYLADLCQEMSGYIHEKKVATSPATGEFGEPAVGGERLAIRH